MPRPLLSSWDYVPEPHDPSWAPDWIASLSGPASNDPIPVEHVQDPPKVSDGYTGLSVADGLRLMAAGLTEQEDDHSDLDLTGVEEGKGAVQPFRHERDLQGEGLDAVPCLPPPVVQVLPDEDLYVIIELPLPGHSGL